ncbi:glycosyltransferase family 4 protein [Thermodesulfobacteriota bacterium]
MDILCPIASGSGAYLVHQMLAERLRGYRVCTYHPYWTLLPPALFFKCRAGQYPDLIHTAADYAAFFSNRKSKHVITFHSFVWDRETQQYSTPLQRLHHQSDLRLFVIKALKIADMVTTVSDFTSDLIKREFQYQKPVKIIRNGIDTSVFKPLSRVEKNDVRVLFSGNLTKRKGAHFLPQIAQKLDRQISLTYTGGLKNNNFFKSQDNLINLGHTPYSKMAEVYQKSDILVFPSVREGFGLAIAEAMACGLPVVASNCSSIPELVEHRLGGYLCGVGDIDDFAEKINVLAGNPELRKRMGDYNRKRAERLFSIGRMVDEYRELFENILGLQHTLTIRK